MKVIYIFATFTKTLLVNTLRLATRTRVFCFVRFPGTVTEVYK